MKVFDLSVSSFSKLMNAYQVQAISKVIRMIEMGESKIYVLGPAGSGKTAMSIFLSEVLYGKHRNKKILFLHYNKVLSLHLSKQLIEIYSPEDVTDLKENRVDKPGFYFTTWHQIRNRLDEIYKEFDYVITDEVQDFSNESSKLFSHFNSTFITFGQTQINNYNSVIPIFSVGSIFADSYSEDETSKLRKELEFYKNELMRMQQENQNLHEKNLELLERNSSTKDMFELLQQITVKVDEGFAGVNERLDKLESLLESLKNTLHILQNQYEKTILNANIEEERETLIHQFSEDFMDVLLKKFHVSTQEGYKQEKDKLLSIFGPINWKKLSDESRQYIITSNILFNNMANYEHQVDYSPVCIPLTKALESELYIHFFSNLISNLRERNIPLQDWPHGLTTYNSKQNKYYEIPSHKFTLGSIPYILGTKQDVKRPKGEISSLKVMMPYLNKSLTFSNKNELMEYLNKLDKGVQYVTINYRNPAAHKDKIGLEHALSCYNYMIKVTGLLVELSQRLKV